MPTSVCICRPVPWTGAVPPCLPGPDLASACLGGDSGQFALLCPVLLQWLACLCTCSPTVRSAAHYSPSFACNFTVASFQLFCCSYVRQSRFRCSGQLSASVRDCPQPACPPRTVVRPGASGSSAALRRLHCPGLDCAAHLRPRPPARPRVRRGLWLAGESAWSGPGCPVRYPGPVG